MITEHQAWRSWESVEWILFGRFGYAPCALCLAPLAFRQSLVSLLKIETTASENYKQHQALGKPKGKLVWYLPGFASLGLRWKMKHNRHGKSRLTIRDKRGITGNKIWSRHEQSGSHRFPEKAADSTKRSSKQKLPCITSSDFSEWILRSEFHCDCKRERPCIKPKTRPSGRQSTAMTLKVSTH